MAASEPIDLLIEPRWLLPMAPHNAVLASQAVAVSAGRIVAVGPAAELRARFAPRSHIVREHHALLPGLVNGHTRACHALLQGLPLRTPRRRWLAEVVAPLERRGLSADFVRDGTRLAIAAMLRAGITCFADLSPLPAESARTAAAAQMRALIGLPVSDAPSASAEDASGHLQQAERLWDEYRDDPRIGLYFAPLPAPLSSATLTRLRRVADELDARISVHVDELPQDAQGVADGEAGAPLSLERMQALGLLRPGFSAIGAFGLTAEQRELLGRHGCTLIACPQAELRLGSAPGSAALPLERAALGTDSAAAAGGIDLLAEARTAALLLGLKAPEALRLATLSAAQALGLGGEIGSIETGKAADLTCIELGALAHDAARDVSAALVFGATRSEVSDVWMGGRAALSERRLQLFDAEELAALPSAWARRLALEAAA
jgi:5-methylthioadenosine/S-adenosylhomocysteine deaminase